MSVITQIDSIRNFEQYPSYLILYELEDDIANTQNIPVHLLSKWKYLFGKLIFKSVSNIIIKRATPPGFIFSIMMTPDYHRLYLNKTNVIPYIIDYWKRYDALFEKHFAHFPVVYISGLEVYEYLKAKRTKVKIKHLPLSISDRYLSLFEEQVNKDIDIINVGRKNKVMDEYIQQYLLKYPNTNYVHREMENGENIYYSSVHGRLGTLTTRDDLLKILSRSKIAIVTSPGLDGGEQRTGGFNPVTPRVFEAAIGKCYMIGKYEKNSEYYSFGLDKLVEMPNSYIEFETMVQDKLKTPFNRTDDYAAFLKANLNSVRIAQLKRDLEK
jgi:hypothetical protein